MVFERVDLLPDSETVWHTAWVLLINRRFFYGYRIPVPVAC
jgi:hypothetical protein